MSVILFGYHNMGCVALNVLNKLGLEVAALFTHMDDPDENRWFSVPSPIATKHDIPVFYPENVNEAEWIERIKKIEPEVILSCYYRNMISEKILEIPSVAAVNLHGSLLPAYRGRCPVNWQLVNGEKQGGVTLHHMVKQADAGDIIAMKSVEISDEDDPVSLFAKLESAAEEVLEEFIPKLLNGTAPRSVQDHSNATYFGGRRPEDGKIDWSWDARRIFNLIRAVTWPYPGAFAMLNGQKIMFWKAAIKDETYRNGIIPGMVEMNGRRAYVHTGKGLLEIICITEEGKTPADGCSIELIKNGDLLK